MQTFSYDPTKITDNGIHQMRFELGDTVVDMGGISAALCDEEYQAIIDQHGKSWRKAKCFCLRAIVMKLSFEVDTRVDGLSYSLSQRYDRWKKMLEEAEAELKALNSLPIARKSASSSSPVPPGISINPYSGKGRFDVRKNQVCREKRIRSQYRGNSVQTDRCPVLHSAEYDQHKSRD